MTKERSEKIIGKLKSIFVGMKTDLLYNDLYELTIAVILSAQTTDSQVNKVTPILFQRYPDFQSLSEAKRSDVETIIKSIGLYRNKSKNIINLSMQLLCNNGGKLPSTRDELMKFPGIGRKTANVILSIGLGKDAFAVDTHVLRVANRLGYVKSKCPLNTEIMLTSFIPKKDWKQAHILFIRLGRNICRAKKPLCEECPVKVFCDGARNIP